MKRLGIWLFAAASAALWAGPAAAQVMDTGDGGGTPVTGSIGVGAVYAPEFAGSDKSEAKPLPYFNLRYGPVFLSTSKGLGIRFDLMGGALELSPALNYRWPRDEGDSDLLFGMGDVKGELTGGATVAYHMDDVTFAVRGFQAISGDSGFNMDMILSYLNRQHETFHWGLAAEAGFADSEYNRTYFGVNEEQSARSGYNAYSPSAGLKDVSFGGTVDYYIAPNISVDLFAKYTRITGEAFDSPLVLRGSPNQFSTGLLLFYHFGAY
ncbi:MAG: MipA/OmpV family protein [Deltaproteobacteria bacterium]|jgi:outer membrane scaffolding protein for murein synthesis (MipA/OmpV family)|nr:MipA/OmpV family protein [Deltaproteobacteria bacterium]